MTAYEYIVIVDCETNKQSHKVMAERILHDEFLGFDYEVSFRKAPELWVLMIDGPEFDSATVHPTAEAARQHIRDNYDEALGEADPIHALVKYGYIIDLQKHDYPTNTGGTA